MAKSKFQKKKEREREVRKKILARRANKNAQEKENAKFDAEEKSVRHRQHPIRNEELYAAKRMRDLEIRMQLEHNMELLKGLQAEYEEELKKREAYLNELKEQAEACEACVPPEDELNEDGTLKDKPSLVEKATDHLGSIFETSCAGFAPAPTETVNSQRSAAAQILAEKRQEKQDFQQHLRDMEKK